MARNGSGTYSKVNTFVAGNTITAAGHNENWDDLVTEMSNSVAADGQTTITAALKAANGTVTTPGYGFGADTNTGIYRIAADNLGVAVGGTKILDVASTGLTVVGTLTADAVTATTISIFPAGIIVPYAGSAAPTGWLLCDGSSLLRASYAALFTAIGTTYGAADGTHFSVPDLTGRIIAGKESSATRLTAAVGGVDGGTLGATGGAESVTLTTTTMPAHTHSIGAATHSHTMPNVNPSFVSDTSSGNIGELQLGGGGGFRSPFSTFPIDLASTGITGTNSAGTGSAHANVQPTIVLNYIIKT